MESNELVELSKNEREEFLKLFVESCKNNKNSILKYVTPEELRKFIGIEFDYRMWQDFKESQNNNKKKYRLLSNSSLKDLEEENLEKVVGKGIRSFEDTYNIFGDLCGDFSYITTDVFKVIWNSIKESERSLDNFKKLFGLVNEKDGEDDGDKIKKFKIIGETDPKILEIKVDIFHLLTENDRTMKNLLDYFLTEDQLKKLSDKDKIELFRSLSSYKIGDSKEHEASGTEKLECLKLFFSELQNLEFNLKIQLLTDFVDTINDVNASEENKKTPKIEISVLSNFFPNETEKFSNNNPLIARLGLAQVVTLLEEDSIKKLEINSKLLFLSKFCVSGQEKTSVTKDMLSKFLSSEGTEKLDDKFQYEQNLKLEDVLFALFPKQVEELPDVRIYLKANFFELFDYDEIRNIRTKQQLLELLAHEMGSWLGCIPEDKRYEFLKWIYKNNECKLQKFSFGKIEDLMIRLPEDEVYEFLGWVYEGEEGRNELLKFQSDKMTDLVCWFPKDRRYEFMKWVYEKNKDILQAFKPREMESLVGYLPKDRRYEFLGWVYEGEEGRNELLKFQSDEMTGLVCWLPEDRRYEFIKWVYEGEEGRKKLLGFKPDEMKDLICYLPENERYKFLKWVYEDNKGKLQEFKPIEMKTLVRCLPEGKEYEFVEWVYKGEKGRDKLQSYSCEDVYDLSVSMSPEKDRLEFFKMAVTPKNFKIWVENKEPYLQSLCRNLGKTEDELRKLLGEKEKEVSPVNANTINQINSNGSYGSIQEKKNQNTIDKNNESTNMSLVNNSGETMINSKDNIEKEEY